MTGTVERVGGALGIPRPDAEQRPSGSEEREGVGGELLDLAGLFDVHLALDECGGRIGGLMHRAAGALGGYGSAAAFGLHRKTATGRLPEVYALHVRTPVREPGDAARHWALATTVGEELAARLPPGDEGAGRVGEARERCAREAAAAATAR